MRFKKILKNLKFDNYLPGGHQCPKKFNIIKKYKDNVSMYTIQIHDKLGS